VPAEQEPEVRDATRRTRLANERTYLAWWRTGLTAVAISLGAGRLVPELSGGAAWPYQAIGVGYALLGAACVVGAYRRHRSVDTALSRGEDAPLDGRVTLALAAAGGVLALATALVVLFAQ
jgi:putative membrane protein